MIKPEHLLKKAAAVAVAGLVICQAGTVWADTPELLLSDYEYVHLEAMNDVHEHSIVIDEGVEPGLFSAGLTEGSHCAECGEVIVPQEVIPARDLDGALAYGSSGSDVLELQEQLYAMGYLETWPDGDYGWYTQQAVSAFQRDCGMENPDGVFGNWSLSVMRDGDAGAVPYEPEPKHIEIKEEDIESYLDSATAVEPEEDKHGRGNRNSFSYSYDDIYALQEVLYNLGYLYVEPTGFFGDLTRDALARFQQDNGLEATREPDDQTVAALNGTESAAADGEAVSDNSEPVSEERGSHEDHSRTVSNQTDLSVGSSGDAVYRLQEQLYNLGYLYDEPDGEFGYVTQSAVEAFQADYGLYVSGVADAQTLDLLGLSDDTDYAYAGEDDADSEESFSADVYDHEPVSSNVSLGQEIVDYAMQWVGVTPYVDYWERINEDGEFFNSFTDGTDCSGFVHLVFAHFGIYAPPGSDEYQNNVGVRISEAELLPGDIIVYRGGGHVGIYAGNGMLIHCSSPERGTVYDDMWYETPTAYVRVIF